MARIDTGVWREFKLIDIFWMNNTKSIVQKDVVPDSGTIPYVTAQASNNGVLTYVDCPLEWLDEGNCIMIGGKTLTFSYQEKAFCSNDSHNIALHLKDDTKASKERYLFLIAALRGALYQKYSWGDSVSMKTIKDDTFRLPVDVEGEPDWAYMDAYMSETMREAEESLAGLNAADGKKRAVDVSEWREFVVGDLFETETKGKSTQVPTGGWVAMKLLSDGLTPRITVSGVNNGVVGYYADIDDANYRVYEKFISVSFLGTVFYQRGRASLDMKVHCLKPIDVELTDSVAAFLVTMIRVAIQRFEYQDQLSSTVLPSIKLKLPATFSGEPDWAFMDEYMRSIMDCVQADLSSMQSIE